MKARVAHYAELKEKDLGGGNRRKVMAYNDNLMIVEVSFDTGTIGSMHTHPHTQCSYVLQGKFRYKVEDEVTELCQGDSIVVPGNVLHGCECTEQGVLLDIFTPRRDDFLES